MSDARGKTRYRRSASVVLYWRGCDLVIDNFALRTSVGVDPIVCSILDFCHDWRSHQEVAQRLGNYDQASVRKALNDLYEHGALERSDRRRDPRVEAMESWAPWNPAAGFFHFTTKDTQFAPDQRSIYRELQHRAKHDPLPVALKRYPQARRTKLPQVQAKGEFPAVLKSRRTWRKYGRAPVPLNDFAQTLQLTFGIQRWVNIPDLGRVAIKTSPSGGSLHPIEAYVLVRRVEGLQSGIYHYQPGSHGLEWLRNGIAQKTLERHLGYQSWFAKGAFLVLMAAVFGRTRWKYDFPRVYRGILLEAGHLCQTFCLTATWLGLAPFCTFAHTDTQWEKWLGLDGVTESVLYVAGAGTQPDSAAMRHANILRIGNGDSE